MILDLVRGKAITIPPMDGALRPNTALEDAAILCRMPAPDNLTLAGGEILFSSGAEVFSLPGPKLRMSFDSIVSALAADDDGSLAVGLDAGEIEVRGKRIEGFNCPVALAFGDGGELYVCNGSATCSPANWVSDLMNRNAKGSVWRVDLGTGKRQCLASGLAFPYGIALDQDRLIVSESWRHRVIGIPLAGGAPTELLAKLPGYPARIADAPAGYAMALFAPRNRLIEFVLREDQYRAAMMAEIDSRYWIAPSLSASRSFLEPLQNGAVKTMGIHKPWSPTRSYGLVVELDRDLQPVTSHHSRANGTRHGITSVIAADGAIIAACKGGDAILRIAAA